MKDIIEDALLRYKEREINGYIRRVACLEASEEALRRELEQKDVQLNKQIEQIMGSNNVGLRAVLHELRELQATCAEQAAQIAGLTKDCSDYKKRCGSEVPYEQALEDSSMCKQDLLKVSQKEASLEAHASELKCQLTDTQTCLEEVERRKIAIQVRSQELQQRLERYIDDEAKKHQELVQMMDRRMRMATIRINQYREQRQKLVCELRLARKRNEQLDEHLQERTREIEELRCQAGVKDCELQQVRSAAEQEKAHMDVHLRQAAQEARCSQAECELRTTELQQMKKDIGMLETQVEKQAQESDNLRADLELKEAELAQLRKTAEHQTEQLEVLVHQRTKDLDAARSAGEMKDSEIMHLRKMLEQQRNQSDQQTGRLKQDLETARYNAEVNEKEVLHLKKLLEQQKRDHDAELQHRDHELEVKNQDLHRARDIIEKKQHLLDASQEESEEKDRMIEDLRASLGQLKRRIEEIASDHRMKIDRMQEDFQRQLKTKLREMEEQKELEFARKLEEVSEDIRREHAKASDAQRRKWTAEAQRMQAMILTLTNQNRGLVKQCKLLATKLEESTRSIEKLKDSLQNVKCKLLDCTEKAREAAVLRQRTMVLERTISTQKVQAQSLTAEANALREDRDRLETEIAILEQKTKTLLGNCETLEKRNQELEKDLLMQNQQIRERTNDIGFLREEIAARTEEAGVYKDNLKAIWTCVVQQLPIQEGAQADVCVSRRMTAETVRRVQGLLADGIEELCGQASLRIEQLERRQLEERLCSYEQEAVAQRQTRSFLEESIRAKEREVADLDLALTVANEKLLGRDQQLCMNSAAKAEIEATLHATEQRLQDVTKELKDVVKEKESLSKRLSACEHEFAALSRAESETALKLTARDRELASVCNMKDELEDRVADSERKIAELCTENSRLEVQLATCQEALKDEKKKNEELYLEAEQLEKKCFNTKKECQVLLDANKANSENFLRQSARSFETELQELELKHQAELQNRDADHRNEMRLRTEQLTAEAAQKEARLMAEMEDLRREYQAELQFLRDILSSTCFEDRHCPRDIPAAGRRLDASCQKSSHHRPATALSPDVRSPVQRSTSVDSAGFFRSDLLTSLSPRFSREGRSVKLRPCSSRCEASPE
ncbi:myosin heavy chain [Cystoisospora suis]|uniref:Myosin heavy chain n=1 Tax=Cystoisospora suis TaxID=483139 RepID=A0A2C6LCW5_9APIC|nr:myosin heavy chain [Cystoisospora suis]